MTMPTPRQKAILLAAFGLLVAAAAVAAAVALEAPAPPVAAKGAPAADAPHGMDADARCAHMPEHCGGGARGA